VAQGISNRESPDEEAIERKEHPPLETPGSSADVTAQADEESIEGDRQTSSKAGSRSLGQKEAASKYSDRQMPASAKVDGAFGKEKR
jgi:hypothetical protein